MQELTVKQSQAHLLLEAISNFCGTIKINVKEEVITDEGRKYHVKLDIDIWTKDRINIYINNNTEEL